MNSIGVFYEPSLKVQIIRGIINQLNYIKIHQQPHESILAMDKNKEQQKLAC